VIAYLRGEVSGFLGGVEVAATERVKIINTYNTLL
jgi:hypothetical protein